MLPRAYRLILPLVISSTLLSAQTKLKPIIWPQISPLHWSGTVDALGEPTRIAINSVEGRTVYELYCSSFLGPSTPEWLTGGDNYGGDFECLLTDSVSHRPADRATLLNYVPEDTSPYHFNRGSFHWKELVGQCWDDEEWGLNRKLYLRQMRLEIKVSGAKVEMYNGKRQRKPYPIIRNVDVTVTAMPDETATTRLVRKPKRAEPMRCMDD